MPTLPVRSANERQRQRRLRRLAERRAALSQEERNANRADNALRNAERRATLSGDELNRTRAADFRQMLAVIPKANRAAIVDSCVNRSFLWRHFKVFHLVQNMRLIGNQATWAQGLLEIGEGVCDDEVPIPDQVKRTASVQELIQDVYGDENGAVSDFEGKTILTPLNKDVQMINDTVLDSFPGEAREFNSFDAIPPGEVHNASLYPTEFLNSINTASLPLHKLRLKIGCVVILLRNLDSTRGLCNGTRLRVDAFYRNMIQAVVISQGAFHGNVIMIPRIALYPSDTNLPFRFKRLQFPIRLAFAMSINKAQGQTLDKVGLYLPTKLFAHGHLYVALSRTRSGPQGIIFHNPDPTVTSIRNVVYREVFEV